MWLCTAVVAALLAAPAGAFASQAHPTLAEMEPLVMCPTCNTTLDRSDSPAAERVRRYIRGRIEAGWTRQQILDGVVAEYGGDQSILAAPPARSATGIAAWGMPLGLLVAAVAAGALMVRTWVRRGRAGRAGVSGR